VDLGYSLVDAFSVSFAHWADPKQSDLNCHIGVRGQFSFWLIFLANLVQFIDALRINGPRRDLRNPDLPRMIWHVGFPIRSHGLSTGAQSVFAAGTSPFLPQIVVISPCYIWPASGPSICDVDYKCLDFLAVALYGILGWHLGWDINALYV